MNNDDYRIRTKRIQIRLTEEELQYAKAKADYCMLSMSEYIRKIIFEGAVIKYEPFDIVKLANELNKIGKELFNIQTAIYNSNNKELREEMDCFQEAFEKMEEVVYAAVYGCD